ncbi:MAG: single-stranded DNA-binding protein [Candidatus Omnitrophica bacterium]|nr:single-stranded DNA-binding protein [Candidatus Omnitrophota bacterium]MDD5352868.1 single-stranded DNA-binding protein [Candidatus Omnitrophota bacterium]MDD5550467.1 single-stranded DNA-binding protein [Candidatus Omnitrophota bacterium]
MANLNKVFLIGNLTRDPELRYTPSGMAVANLRLAVNHRFKDRSGELKQDACFVNIVVWDKQAETCNQYLQKGRSVLIEGRLQSRSWKDNEGKNRSVIEVRADRVVFLDNANQKKSEVKDNNVEAVEEINSGKPGAVPDELSEVSWPQEMDEQPS